MKVCPRCNTRLEDAVHFCPHDGEVPVDDPSALVGTTLDGLYRVEALLGKGGMGAVYRARHVLLDDLVAIKVIPPEMARNADWLRRFVREGQAGRRFRHPNAVAVYDLRTTTEGLTFMVHEHVDGQNLRAALRERGRFSPGEVVDLLAPVAGALDAAHASGVIHRDVKPDNIMVGRTATGEPIVKLLDLGIAKLRETVLDAPLSELTVPGQVLGSAPYMSPEQWGAVPRDGGPEIDERTDVYSLGVVAYELVAGQMPFVGRTLQDFLRQHVSAVARPLHDLVPGVTREFGRAVAHAMEKDRSDRPASASRFVAELRSALEDSSKTARDAYEEAPPTLVTEEAPPHDATNERSRETSTRVGATLVWVAAVALCLALGAGLVYRRIAAPAADSGPVETVTPSTTPDRVAPPTSPAALRYSVEVKGPDGRVERVSGRAPLASDSFRFRFASQASGYLYIIAADSKSILGAILTSRPNPKLGKTSNALEPDVDFVYPVDTWMKLERSEADSGPTRFIVVFSAEPLAAPTLLTGPAYFASTHAQRQEIDEFLRRFPRASVDVAPEDPSTAAVFRAPAGEAGAPVIFDIFLSSPNPSNDSR